MCNVVALWGGGGGWDTTTNVFDSLLPVRSRKFISLLVHYN